MLCIRQPFKQLHKSCLAPIFWISGDGRCSFYGNVKTQKPRFAYSQRVAEKRNLIGSRISNFTGDVLIKGALCELRLEHITIRLCQPENVSLLQSSFVHDLLQPLRCREWPHISAPLSDRSTITRIEQKFKRKCKKSSI